jgi:tetratricopeptide (TPR) repeat protein
VRSVAAILVLLAATSAAAQPTPLPPADTGFIGKASARLEIDDCPASDPAASKAQLELRFSALYARGEVLYAQGDYTGAVAEFITGYCVAGEFDEGRRVRYSLLNDIGQAHERNLDYEKAIAYFERFVHDFPSVPDQRDKRLIESRMLVLQKLRAQILVESSPGGASVKISNEGGVAGLGRSGRPIEVPGGAYKMLVELEGYEPYTQEIEVRIGKPFAFFVPLRPRSGRLSVQITPADARVFLRDKTVERFAGIGRVDEVLPAGEYVLIAEAADRLKEERPIEVLPDQVNRMQIDLPHTPQFGRRQLVAYATFGAAFSTGGLLYALGDSSIAGLGGAGGAALGLFGSLLYLPEQVPLGTSDLTITSGLAGTVAGITSALLFTDSERVVWPIQGAATLLGASVGYYLGHRNKISAGDAALFNSSVAWGTAAGGLFALSFGADDRRITAGLILSGLGMGTVSGVLMTRYFEISRRHAFLIDIGGLVGVLGGLATESLAYPKSGAGEGSPSENEHAANFMLGGVAIGLIGAGFLTRNLDTPKLPVKPAVGAVTTASGGPAAVYGISGSW